MEKETERVMRRQQRSTTAAAWHAGGTKQRELAARMRLRQGSAMTGFGIHWMPESRCVRAV